MVRYGPRGDQGRETATAVLQAELRGTKHALISLIQRQVEPQPCLLPVPMSCRHRHVVECCAGKARCLGGLRIVVQCVCVSMIALTLLCIQGYSLSHWRSRPHPHHDDRAPTIETCYSSFVCVVVLSCMCRCVAWHSM